MVQTQQEVIKTQNGPIQFAELEKQVREIVNRNRGKAGALITVLQQVQGVVGYLPLVVLRMISKELNVSLSEVTGIVTFYHLFSMVPKGKYIIEVCKGTSCYVKGGQKIIETVKKDFGLEPGGITDDGKFSLQIVRCIGCCALSPTMRIGNNVYRRVQPTRLKELLSVYK